ncbi:hypothetical protein Hanom_Chr10g00934781 [Helianthus anomalus]
MNRYLYLIWFSFKCLNIMVVAAHCILSLTCESDQEHFVVASGVVLVLVLSFVVNSYCAFCCLSFLGSTHLML